MIAGPSQASFGTYGERWKWDFCYIRKGTNRREGEEGVPKKKKEEDKKAKNNMKTENQKLNCDGRTMTSHTCGTTGERWKWGWEIGVLGDSLLIKVMILFFLILLSSYCDVVMWDNKRWDVMGWCDMMWGEEPWKQRYVDPITSPLSHT